ncbi:hypothetical protein WA026_023229 [Henosepilachna vigintioctopunctata]|uniref:Uncharacterized protein n=1 Tax=Henosepilachna vigintioctopunctata TaxID=420089 RepID=A0AAW1VHS0_9CUCU
MECSAASETWQCSFRVTFIYVKSVEKNTSMPNHFIITESSNVVTEYISAQCATESININHLFIVMFNLNVTNLLLSSVLSMTVGTELNREAVSKVTFLPGICHNKKLLEGHRIQKLKYHWFSSITDEHN